MVKELFQNKLFISIILTIIGNLVAWVHMNAQFRWEWAKGPWFITLIGIPISWSFYYATRYSVEYFGKLWTMRMMGFGIGTIIFGGMAWLFLEEIPTLKTVICLLLALSIILIQVTNVIK